MTRPPVIRLDQVSFSFGGPPVLQNVQLEVADGEFLGVVGPNAGGKSTLLKIILGLLKPTQGRVQLLGRPPKESRREVGYVPQYPTFARDFPVTVEQTVLMGRLGRTRRFGGYRRADRTIARQCMDEMEILDLDQRRLDTLSGGQLQRVLVARALAGEPRILILDEPTANIYMRVESEIFDLLKTLNRRMSIVFVSHDIGFIYGYIHRVACVNRTLICHHTASLDGAMIEELYGTDVRMVQHVHH